MATILNVMGYVGTHCTTDLNLEIDAAREWLKGRIAAVRNGTSVETGFTVMNMTMDEHNNYVYPQVLIWTPGKGWHSRISND